MTRALLIQRVNEERRAGKLFVTWFVVGVIGIIISGLFLIAWKCSEEQSWLSWGYLVCGVLCFLGGSALMMRSARNIGRRESESRIICPSCAKTISGHGRLIAIATGNCCHCGEPVFAE